MKITTKNVKNQTRKVYIEVENNNQKIVYIKQVTEKHKRRKATKRTTRNKTKLNGKMKQNIAL